MRNKALGYYTCNGVEFYSKVDACIYAQLNQKPLEWHFLDEVYNKYNWTVEPELSLDSLYDLRARELREKYDYLILSYSGGSDSNNILESFIRQNLHIDEILTGHMSKATNSTTVLDTKVTASWNFYAEHELQTVPRLKYIHDKLPKTKITVLDMSDTVLASLKDFENERWALHRGDHLSIGQPTRTNYLYFSTVKKQFDKGQRVGFIIGIEKPITFIKGEDFYLRLGDKSTSLSHVNDYNNDYDNVITEYFYWADTTADLLCKQAHVIKRWLSQTPTYRELWSKTDWEIWRSTKEKVTRQLIYSTWNPRWYQSDKSSTWWHSEFDRWFNNHSELALAQQNWQRGIDFLSSAVGKYINYSNKTVPDGLLPFGKDFYIGKI